MRASTRSSAAFPRRRPTAGCAACPPSPTTAGSGWSSASCSPSARGPLRRGAIRGLGSLAFSSGLVNVVLKRIFGRVRPDLENLQAHRRLRREPGTLSFPSGHSSSAAAFVTGVAMESPLVGAALAPVALGVGYSRVHVGVHYPGDVVAGLAVGGAVAAATQHWWRVRPKQPARVRTTSEAPALPEGEGLVVAVNPRSGPDDYDPVEDISGCCPARRSSS